MSFTLTLKSFLVDKHSNESLMLRYAGSGDKSLLIKLYDGCSDDLYHFVLTLSDPALAHDICQKTWLKVMEKKHLYQDSGKFKAWLFTLARNQLIDELRKVKATTDNLDKLMDAGESLEQNLYQVDIDQAFEHALLSLPFEQKEAFCLQQEGFSLEEIAKMTHSGSETIKSRLRYAKQHLRKHLKKYSEIHHG